MASSDSEPGSADDDPARKGGGVPIDGDGDGLPDGAWVRDQRRQANAMGVGLQFGAAIVVFAFAGLWADRSFGTSPWLLIVGVALGFLGGTVSLLKKFK